MFTLPKWLLVQPPKVHQPSDHSKEAPAAASSTQVGTNVDRPVIDLYRPHIVSGDCLIVTGYQDLLSSLSILVNELPRLKELDAEPTDRIRIVFGVDTANAQRMGSARSVSDEMRLYWLERSGLQVEDEHDLLAVLAKRAIERGNIDLRVFDPELARKTLNISGDRRLHSKIVSSPLGAIAGSANFSRSGLYSNIEYADGLAKGSHELELERKTSAEQIWEASVDWNAEALEILGKLIKPVTAEDAVARMIAEQRGFAPWLTGNRQEITGHTLYGYQQELVYEACSTAYEHGMVFVESPTGSGKTEIGCHLAEALSETFSQVVPKSPVHGVARKNAAVVAPPKVIPSWKRYSTNSLEAVPNSKLAKQHLRGAGDDGKSGLRLDQYGVLIIDESHTVTPAFEQASQMAAAIELAPPCWNVCLSATLLGNRDLDWLAHMQEKRASIFMTPRFIQAMGELFDRETKTADQTSGGGVPRSSRDLDANTALSEEARLELAELLSPFLTRRQRRCIGETKDPAQQGYPKLNYHGRPKRLKASKPQKTRLDEIVSLCDGLAPGSRVTATETSRFGNSSTQQSTLDQLFIRNLLNILRVNSAHAHWEMTHGAIGKALRDFERRSGPRRKVKAQDQLDMFSALDIEHSPEAKNCEALTRKLNTRALAELDEKRYEACLRIQEGKDRVVFLAERIDTLEIYAEELSRRGQHSNYVVGTPAQDKQRAVDTIYGGTPDSFKRIKEGRSVESYFRPGGKNAPQGAASVFLTYKMAEGINLQSADTLVLLGATSNLKELIQGLGRIDRIDSSFSEVNYHLIDVPVGKFASDEKVAQRIENYKTLASEGNVQAVVEEDPEDSEAILSSTIEYLRSPRLLRPNNLHDVFEQTKKAISKERFDLVSRAKIDGTWGAELALLASRESFTALHLKGIDGHGRFYPPRLVLLQQKAEGFTFERDQVTCAKSIEAAYERTRSLGLHRQHLDLPDLTEALETVSGQIGTLREWDLRPARVESLMRACAAFISEKQSLSLDDEAMFGHYSLPAIEMVCEAWSRLLDPYWEEAKHEVRESFSIENVPKGYIALPRVLEKLEENGAASEVVFEKMSKVISEAEGFSREHNPDIGNRISVVLFAEGVSEN